MIARIGEDGPPFLIGSERTFTAERSGQLYLGINDTGVDNNEGTFQVNARIL